MRRGPVEVVSARVCASDAASLFPYGKVQRMCSGSAAQGKVQWMCIWRCTSDSGAFVATAEFGATACWWGG